jgi:uncharacterized protein (DUF1501 family)
MDRREALKRIALGATFFATEGFLNLKMKPAHAATAKFAKGVDTNTMVFIFQRGGCDGLNVVVPYGDSDYYTLRPGIGLDAPDLSNPNAALNLDGFFGFNPAMGPLLPLFQAGDLAVFPTTHYQGASRSHFDSQLLIETGSANKYAEGYLNRHLQIAPSDTHFRAVGIGNELPVSLRGDVTVPTLESLGILDLDTGSAGGCSEYNIMAELQKIYAQEPDPAKPNHALVHAAGNQVFQDLETFAEIDADYEPDNGAVYPDNSYGRHLRLVAQLIKEGLGLEIATISIGGWDTHADQLSNQANALRSFSEGLSAFYTDLGDFMNKTVVVTGTEFGRTAAENASGGTDHGHASSWFVLGKNVNGGQVYGDWPGLDTEGLLYGRYLKDTMNYKDIVGEVLQNHIGGTNVATVFPEHNYQPMNILQA